MTRLKGAHAIRAVEAYASLCGWYEVVFYEQRLGLKLGLVQHADGLRIVRVDQVENGLSIAPSDELVMIEGRAIAIRDDDGQHARRFDAFKQAVRDAKRPLTLSFVKGSHRATQTAARKGMGREDRPMLRSLMAADGDRLRRAADALLDRPLDAARRARKLARQARARAVAVRRNHRALLDPVYAMLEADATDAHVTATRAIIDLVVTRRLRAQALAFDVAGRARDATSAAARSATSSVCVIAAAMTAALALDAANAAADDARRAAARASSRRLATIDEPCASSVAEETVSSLAPSPSDTVAPLRTFAATPRHVSTSRRRRQQQSTPVADNEQHRHQSDTIDEPCTSSVAEETMSSLAPSPTDIVAQPRSFVVPSRDMSTARRQRRRPTPPVADEKQRRHHGDTIDEPCASSVAEETVSSLAPSPTDIVAPLHTFAATQRDMSAARRRQSTPMADNEQRRHHTDTIDELSASSAAEETVSSLAALPSPTDIVAPLHTLAANPRDVPSSQRRRRESTPVPDNEQRAATLARHRALFRQRQRERTQQALARLRAAEARLRAASRATAAATAHAQHLTSTLHIAAAEHHAAARDARTFLDSKESPRRTLRHRRNDDGSIY